VSVNLLSAALTLLAEFHFHNRLGTLSILLCSLQWLDFWGTTGLCQAKGFWHLWSGTPPFCWTPQHAGSSHQNWARPTEFSSCCTDRLELSSGTSALNTDWLQTV